MQSWHKGKGQCAEKLPKKTTSCELLTGSLEIRKSPDSDFSQRTHAEPLCATNFLTDVNGMHMASMRTYSD